MNIRDISLDTEFLEAGRHPVTQAAQIMFASVALVDVFNTNAFYGVHTIYDDALVEKLLLYPQYSTIADEDPAHAQKLLAFQRSSVLPKLKLDDKHIPNTLSSISINGQDYSLDYRVDFTPELADSLIAYLARTKGEETHIRLWARQGASDQIMLRSLYNGLMPLKSSLNSIGLKLIEAEINDLPNKRNFTKPDATVSHNSLYDATYDAMNIKAALEPASIPS